MIEKFKIHEMEFILKEKYEVVGKYKIIKNEGLVDIPDYAYEFILILQVKTVLQPLI